MTHTVHLRTLSLLALLAACTGPGEDSAEPLDGPIDYDEDGLTAELDCDDTDPDIGEPREWFADADGDGYGDAAVTARACFPPSGYVADDTDCDDAASTTFPDAQEVCDAVDNDCDGDVDTDATDKLTWYLDADGDGFGDPETGVEDCDPPDTDWVVEGGDCDDEDDFVYPEAFDECGDGLDTDCDGVDPTCPLAGDYDLDRGDAVMLGVGSDDEIGRLLARAGDVTGDGISDLLVGAWDADGCSSCGGVYLVDGSDIPATTDGTPARIVGNEPQSWAGRSSILGTDLNGDGTSDVAVSALTDFDTFDEGGVYVFYGPLTGELDLADADAALLGDETQAWAGLATAAAGDLDGDDVGDLWASVRTTAAATSGDIGVVFLVYGPPTNGTLVSAADWQLRGSFADMGAGVSIVGGQDFDGDGAPDMAAASTHATSSLDDGGAVHIVTTVGSGATTLAGAASHTVAGAPGDRATALSWAGDIDGDGRSDLVVGAPGADSGAGAAYVIHGTDTSAPDTLVAADLAIVGSATDALGTHVAGDGDIDGDGAPELLLGAPGYGDGGAALLFVGLADGTWGTADAQAVLSGKATDAVSPVELLPDVDGDGRDELVIGGPERGSGAAWIVFGQSLD